MAEAIRIYCRTEKTFSQIQISSVVKSEAMQFRGILGCKGGHIFKGVFYPSSLYMFTFKG